MTSDYIIDVSEADFEYQVLTYSQQTPVIVDFWAEWCAPCKVLGPLLEKLTHEAQGNIRLAKVDVDQNQNLALRYAVRSIPAVKAFRHGEVISEFIGAQPEPRLREFIRSIAPSKNDLLIEKGDSLLNLARPDEAEVAFRQVLDQEPVNSMALLGLVKSLLIQGKSGESMKILGDFPTSREYHQAEILLPLVRILEAGELGNEDHDAPLEAAFANALRLIRRGNIEAAMDGLLDILREDKHYRNDLARQVMVALLELMGDANPMTNQYRQELASVLF